MKTNKHLVSILAGLTFVFTSILPVQAAFVFIPIDPIIPILTNPLYVDCSTGLDTNNGITKSTPVKTITWAFALANAGTQTNYQIYVSEGTCASETLPFLITAKDISLYGGYYNNFASRDPINHLTQIKGKNVNVIEITNHSAVLSGFKIYDQTLGDATIKIDNTAAGDNSVTIDGVEINTVTAVFGAIYAEVETGDTLNISGNYINNLSTFGSAISVIGSGTTKIYNNFIYDVLGGISAESSTVYNNIISKFTGVGLNLKANIKAYNNTIVNGNTGISMAAAYSGVEFRNNLSAYNSGKGLSIANPATYSNNGYFDNGTAHTLGTLDVSCDPKLANINSTSTYDYKLGADSTCIDKGTEVSAVTKDYFGAVRKKDGNNDAIFATDIGAHEADGDTAAAPSITAVTASPNTFSPNADGTNDSTTLSYTLNVNSNVIVAIYDDSLTLVKQLTDEVQGSGVHNVSWDGKNTGGTTMAAANYTYRITAQNSESPADSEQGVVTIDLGTTPNPSTLCSGFTDISFNDPMCPAITYVKDQGIFQGYPDGSFKPYNIINRVETTKVVLEGFNITLLADNGTNLGFNDVVLHEWYMTYLRTGKAQGIIEGYPDGSFRPTQQVNRVEMLKIFLETSSEDLALNVTNPPYPDTPINQWYIVYVQFSKLHALVDAAANGNFYPAEGMQRGDVAELFYRAHQEGII